MRRVRGLARLLPAAAWAVASVAARELPRISSRTTSTHWWGDLARRAKPTMKKDSQSRPAQPLVRAGGYRECGRRTSLRCSIHHLNTAATGASPAQGGQDAPFGADHFAEEAAIGEAAAPVAQAEEASDGDRVLHAGRAMRRQADAMSLPRPDQRVSDGGQGLLPACKDARGP